VIEFVIPSVPPSLNSWSRKHWSVRRREAQTWRNLVALAAHGAFLKTAAGSFDPIVIPERAIVSITFRLPRGGDADNRAKFVLDGLVGRFILDDGPPHLAELRLRSERGNPAQTTVRVERA
jgi:hypothetical protein